MKRFKTLLIGVVLLAIAAVICYRVVNVAPDAKLPANQKLAMIMASGGCISCHSSNPQLPFYASWPLAGKLVHADVDSGYRAFDIQPMMDSLNAGKPVNESDLAKVEKVIADGTMPMAKYYLVHWGSSLTGTKTSMALEAIKQIRGQQFPNALAAPEFSNEPVCPVPDSLAVDMRKVALGEKLYFDKRLSADNTVSCSTCHPLEQAGVDNKRLSEGIRGQLGGVNAPTPFNAAFNFVQFWDGRAHTLADQAGGPPLNPVEMGCKSFVEIVAKLKADPTFSRAFCAVYPEGLTQATITNAIQEFEKTLITPNCDFDRYLKGNHNAMSKDAIAGYELFKQQGCATCHVGVNFGGQSYDRMGMKNDYFAYRQKPMTDGDNGRFAQTKVERDRYRYKVPGLRNVELTFPYFHDGYTESLSKAVEVMGKYECGVDFTKEQTASITSFLKALTGEYHGKKLTNPKRTAKND
jgi:cytochrome c peroxidase